MPKLDELSGSDSPCAGQSESWAVVRDTGAAGCLQRLTCADFSEALQARIF